MRSSTDTEQFDLTCSKQTQPALKTSASQRVLNDGLNSSQALTVRDSQKENWSNNCHNY